MQRKFQSRGPVPLSLRLRPRYQPLPEWQTITEQRRELKFSWWSDVRCCWVRGFVAGWQVWIQRIGQRGLPNKLVLFKSYMFCEQHWLKLYINFLTVKKIGSTKHPYWWKLEELYTRNMGARTFYQGRLFNWNANSCNANRCCQPLQNPPKISSMKNAKQALRKQLRAVLAQLSPEQQLEESVHVCNTIVLSQAYQQSTHVCLYLPARPGISLGTVPVINEIDTVPIVRHALEHDKKCFVPVVQSDSEDMQMVQLLSVEEVQKLPVNKFGIPEPSLHSLQLRENRTFSQWMNESGIR